MPGNFFARWVDTTNFFDLYPELGRTRGAPRLQGRAGRWSGAAGRPDGLRWGGRDPVEGRSPGNWELWVRASTSQGDTDHGQLYSMDYSTSRSRGLSPARAGGVSSSRSPTARGAEISRPSTRVRSAAERSRDGKAFQLSFMRDRDDRMAVASSPSGSRDHLPVVPTMAMTRASGGRIRHAQALASGPASWRASSWASRS